MDAHGGKFGAECQGCHDTTSFEHTPGFDHGRTTGFALVGPHRGVSCDGCHGADRARLEKAPKPVTCATCHLAQAKHGTMFGTGCTTCHQPTRFADLKPFDHRRTAFPLERRHAGLKCGACHDPKRTIAVDRECRTCHGDPHRGQAGSQCQDCHRPDRWLLVRFDHDRSEFPLRGRHFTTPCTMCHKNNQWVGVRTECVTCHARDRAGAVSHPPVGFGCGDMGCHTPFNARWKPGTQ